MELKLKGGASLKPPLKDCLRDAVPFALHLLASLSGPPPTFSSCKHFSLLSTSFYSKGMFIFLTGGRRHVTASPEKKKKKKRLLTIRTDVGCLWTKLLIKPSTRFGHWLTPDESEQERKEMEGNTGGKKSVPLFPKAMKRDFDFLKKRNRFHLLSSF